MLTDAAIEILISNWPMLFIFTTIIVSLRLAYVFSHKEEVVFYREILALGFIIYILSLFYAVTFQDVSWSSRNFMPFKEMFRYEIFSARFFKNVIGNIIVFVPYGFYAGYLLKSKKVFGIFLLSLITSLSIEFTQLMIGRVFDVDDIILNVLGGVVGFYIYRFLDIIKEKLPKIFRTNFFYNIVVTIILIALTIYLLSYLKVGI
jgi:glycopeptide antibiotics resistance protein